MKPEVGRSGLDQSVYLSDKSADDGFSHRSGGPGRRTHCRTGPGSPSGPSEEHGQLKTVGTRNLWRLSYRTVSEAELKRTEADC